MSIKRIVPGPGQESVWDYPRPPRLENCSKTIKVIIAGQVLAQSIHAKRVLETSHPPVYYIPPADVDMAMLVPTSKQSWCEWKGRAQYFDIALGGQHALGAQHIKDAAWGYPSPTPAFELIRDHLAFYPQYMDACYVDDEQVQAQAGAFYGGWITNDVVGPFKGEPGTMGW